MITNPHYACLLPDSIRRIIVFSILTYISCNARVEDSADNVQQAKVGNFALPSSQQASPFFGIGQNILDKGDGLGYCTFDYAKGRFNKSNEVVPSFLYGINKYLSIFIGIPFSIRSVYQQFSSSGINDIFAQLEYALHVQETETYVNQITVLANMSIPTGSIAPLPNGFGAPGFLLGCTAAHLDATWYYYTSYGAILPTSRNRDNKFGNIFLYQCGLGRNISTPNTCIFNWLIELAGFYSQPDKICGITDESSRSNRVFLTPSLWLSTERLTLQVGMGFPIVEHLFANGKLENQRFIFMINAGFKFAG
jgi:hypothetical protein